MEGNPIKSDSNDLKDAESLNLIREKFDLLFKLIIIGDTSVGKSCILHHYLRNKCIYIFFIN